jgi:hypothetical protein
VPPDAAAAARGGREYGPAHGCTIEQVERDRLSAKRPYVFRLLSRPGGADHLMAAVDELGDQTGVDRTGSDGRAGLDDAILG